MIQTLFEIVKLQQDLLSNLVNTWDPQVVKKQKKIETLTKNLQQEVNECFARVEKLKIPKGD